MQNKSEEIWMYIKFPTLSLEAITMNYSKDFTNKPLVVIDTHKNKRKIIAYNNLSKEQQLEYLKSINWGKTNSGETRRVKVSAGLSGLT